MKKFFALVLALAMVMSMAAVSMAATKSTVTLGDANRYKADDHLFATDGIQYGETAYFALKIDGDPVFDYELVEKLKVKAEFEMGEELVKGVSIVKKNNAYTGDYRYYVAVETEKKVATSDADVVGTLEFSRKELKDTDLTSQIGEIDKDLNEVDIAFTLFTRKNFSDVPALKVDSEDEVVLLYDTDYVLKFDNDDEVEFVFGGANDGNNEGTFTVDVSGQGKLFVRFGTAADEAIVAANPGVKMHFVNFNNVKFNRTGEFVYELEDGVAAYKVVDGALVEIPGLEVEDGEFTFNTRVLESYVFADAELVNPVVEAPVVAPEVTNPTTGA